MGKKQDLVNLMKRIMPQGLKQIVKNIIFNYRYGFNPPPPYSDLSGYETILDFLKENRIYEVDGDIVEIGVFLGGGTYKLCKFYEKYAPDKMIFAVDIFDPEIDEAECTRGIKMKDLYSAQLKQFSGKSQLDIFRTVTKENKNLEVIIGDSRDLILPCSTISFAYIDGNHSPEYVMNDFYKVWENISEGGVAALDDYGYDLPSVTETVNRIIGKEYATIRKIHTSGLKTIFIMKK